MAKYDPLHDYLRKQRQDELEMSFADVERKIGYMLPKSASQPDWWSGTTTSGVQQVQQKAWSDAGFDAVLIPRADRVLFRRARHSRART